MFKSWKSLKFGGGKTLHPGNFEHPCDWYIVYHHCWSVHCCQGDNLICYVGVSKLWNHGCDIHFYNTDFYRRQFEIWWYKCDVILWIGTDRYTINQHIPSTSQRKVLVIFGDVAYKIRYNIYLFTFRNFLWVTYTTYITPGKPQSRAQLCTFRATKYAEHYTLFSYIFDILHTTYYILRFRIYLTY